MTEPAPLTGPQRAVRQAAARLPVDLREKALTPRAQTGADQQS